VVLFYFAGGGFRAGWVPLVTAGESAPKCAEKGAHRRRVFLSINWTKKEESPQLSLTFLRYGSNEEQQQVPLPLRKAQGQVAQNHRGEIRHSGLEA
jgi:hypothetical protein